MGWVCNLYTGSAMFAINLLGNAKYMYAEFALLEKSTQQPLYNTIVGVHNINYVS